MTMYPHGGAGVKPGQYLKPSQMLSVYARTKFAPEAARIVNFFVEDSRRPRSSRSSAAWPASAAMRKLITPSSTSSTAEHRLYLDGIGARRAAAAPPPNGAGEIQRTLRRIKRGGRLRPPDACCRRQSSSPKRRSRFSIAAEARQALRPARSMDSVGAVAEKRPLPHRRLSRAARGDWRAYLFLLPWFLGFFWPHCRADPRSLYLSFTSFDLVQSPRWIGAANYIRIATSDVNFIAAMKVTFLYVALAVPFKLGFALAVAMALNKGIRGLPLYRAIFYLPSLPRRQRRHRRAVAHAVSPATGWSTRCSPRRHSRAELDLRSRLRDLHLVMLSVWQFGSPMIIFLAGLRRSRATSTRRRASKAPANGGSSAKITLPLLTPVGVLSTPSSRRSTLQGLHPRLHHQRGTGGPVRATLFYTLYLYLEAFAYFRMGYAAALAWILVINHRAVHRLLVPHRALLGHYDD